MTHNAYSYSDINTFGRCPKRYYYRAIEGLQRKVKNKNLYLGIMVHDMLRDFFLDRRAGMDPTLSMRNHRYRCSDTIADLAEDDAMFEELYITQKGLIEDAEDIVTRYLINNLDEILDWQILHVEEEFITVLDSGEVISFTPDLVIRDRDGFVWIVDHKTTSRVPTGEIELGFSDMQQLLYLAGVRTLYPETKGFMFNFLRKKRPAQPRLNKRHTSASKQYGHVFVNNLTDLDTTFEIFRDFLMNEAPLLLGEPAHQRKLAEFREEDRFFWKKRIFVAETELDQALTEAAWTINDIDKAMEQGRYRRVILNDLAGVMSCTKCEFSRLCQGDMLGWDTQLIIDEDYEPRDPKNPYKTEEEAK